MSQEKKDQIFSVIGKLNDESKKDRRIVNALLQEAKAHGFNGDDGVLAIPFLLDFAGAKSQQETMEQMNKQIEELRQQLAEEVAQHKADVDKKIKEIAEGRNTALQLTQKFKVEREELWNNNAQLEQRIKQLMEELNNEKSLRKELSRVGAGMSADKKLLKSKLSAQEFKLLELVEKLVKSENQTRALHETNKRARQQIFGQMGN